MNLTFLLAVIVLALLVTRPPRQPEPEPDPGPVDPTPQDAVTIRAVAGQDAHNIITQAGLGLEDPGLFSPPNHGGRHITVRPGEGPHGQDCFRFVIHPQDCDKQFCDRNRGRNEILGNTGSPDFIKGRSGRIMRFHWWFRMASDYQAVSDDILFQLHATGDDANYPIVKLQADARKSPVSLEFTHDPDNAGPEKRFGNNASFNPLRGQWLEVEVICRFTNNGYLKCSVWDSSRRRIINGESSSIDMHFGDFLRPKWGIYRRKGGKNDFGDWADITIQRLASLP